MTDRRTDLVIVGAGGLAREVLWYIQRINSNNEAYNIRGFIDNNLDLRNKSINGFPIVGDDDWLLNHPEEICAVIAIGNPHLRKTIYNKLKTNKHISFPAIIADDVRFSDSVKFGQGCVVCLSCVLTVNISIGEFVFINLDCTIGHSVVVDDYVTLNPSVNVSGDVNIGSEAEIGTGANIIQGISIGENSIIGAGAVVINDIPPHCTAVGVPAVPVKSH